MLLSQPTEVWGTFSVKDHCRRQPFVAELMLYDRLVIPTPPEDDEAEWRRWEVEEKWDPDRLKRVLDQLGDLAIRVPWNEQRQQEFRDRQSSAARLDPYYITSLQIMLEMELRMPKDQIPRGIERFRPVAAYDSPAQFEREVHVRVPDPREPIERGRLGAILARSFLVPDDPGGGDLETLSKAVEVARDPEFREKRGQFHAWLEDVIRRGLTETEAVLEMRRLVDQYNDVLTRRKVRTALKYAFFVTKVGIYAATAAAALGALPALAAAAPMASGAVLIAEFTSLQARPEPSPPQNTPAAMFYDARKHFGWQ